MRIKENALQINCSLNISDGVEDLATQITLDDSAFHKYKNSCYALRNTKRASAITGDGEIGHGCNR